MKKLFLLPILAFLFGLSGYNTNAQCDIIYVATTGNNANPGTETLPVQTLSAAFSLVTGTRTTIRMAGGAYSESVVMNIANNVHIEGAFTETPGGWTKSTSQTTTITLSAQETIGTLTHRIGFKANGVSGWSLQDLVITTTAIAGQDAAGRGRSNYAVWVNNCSNYTISRCNITSGGAGVGTNGSTGLTGANGSNGSTGNSGSCDGNYTCCFGSESAPGGNGGAGGTGAIGVPGGANNNSTTANNPGANGTLRNGGGGGAGGKGGGFSGGNNATAGSNGGGSASQPVNTAGGFAGGQGDPGGNGGTGGNGTTGATGPTGAAGAAGTHAGGYFVPGVVAATAGDGNGGSGGAGGGGGGRQVCTVCNDGPGNGGSGGGGGGQGGVGGTGGMGGGGSFPVYITASPTGSTISQNTLVNGAAGSGGIGGNGGTGGNGGIGGNPNTTCTSEIGDGGRGGNGGAGGSGGFGGAGSFGLSAQVTNDGITSNPSVIIPYTPTTTATYYGCTNSEITITKASGTWVLPAGGTYISDLTPATSNYTNTSPTAIISFNSVGAKNLGNGTTFSNFLYMGTDRPLPTFGATMVTTICEDANFNMNTPTVGVEYEWVIYADGSSTASPLATFTSPSANWTVPVNMSTTVYQVRLRIRSTCCGWSIPVYFTLTAGDATNPVFVGCPANIAASTDPNLCGAFVPWTPPTASDNCSTPVITSSHTPNQFLPIGITAVTYTATDAFGNAATCNFNITVTDNTNPTMTGCPANITTTTAPNLCGAYVAWTPPSVSDNCPGVSTTATYNSGAFFPVGTTSVLYTATDANGNSATCSFSVTVNDVGTPTFTNCPSNIVTNNTINTCGANVSWTPPTASGGCATLTVTSTANPGDNFPVGTTTVIYTADDGAGNTATCSFNITITDTQNPTFAGCPSNQTVSNTVGSCGANVTWTAPTPSDNCPGVILTSTHNSGDFFTIGNTTVTYTATDAAGNSTNCSFTINVTDNENPVVSGCPAPISVNNDLGLCEAVVSWTAPTETDNCPGVTMTSTYSPGTTFPIGTTTVSYTATDIYANSSVCSFTVTVIDAQNPTFAGCPATINQNNDPGSCSALVNWAVPAASDNCLGVTTTSSHSPGATFPTGTTTVTYTATDASGNTGTCSFNVVISDVENPLFIGCPGPIITNNSAGNCSAIVTWTPPSASDNCAGLTVTSTYNPGATFPVGTTTVTYTATDAVGNSTICSFTVTVNDAQAPTFVGCPANINANNSTGNCSATVTWTAPTSADNCSVTIASSSHNPGDVFPIGTTTVTYTAMDAAGNSGSCSFVVTVIDTEAPAFSGCPANIVIPNDPAGCAAVGTWTAPIASDNCAGVTVTSTHNSGDVFPIGTTTVTYTATDANGLTANCSFTVKVDDSELPVIVGCPGNDTIPAGQFCFTIIPNYLSGISYTDNCPSGLSANQNPSAGTLTSTDTPITITVTDGTGNSAVCSFNLILEDQNAPTISCPLNQTATITSGCSYVVADYTGSASVSDNCDSSPIVTQTPQAGTTVTGVQTITLVATDATGNFSNCSFTVTPIDTENPVITCIGDITTCDPLVVFNAPSTTDNCSSVTVSQIAGIPSGSLYPVGVTTNTFVATDQSGNKDTCSFGVTVYPQPTVDAGSDFNTDPGDQITMDATATGAVSYSWTPASQVSVATGLNPTASPVVTSVFYLTATNASGCTATDSMTVFVKPYDGLTNEDVDNLFTPNGDGKNETWYITEDLKGCNVKVFNGWGNVVFESDNYQNDWDGTFHDDPLPEGAYYYSITCGDNDSVVGSVTILRLKK